MLLYHLRLNEPVHCLDALQGACVQGRRGNRGVLTGCARVTLFKDFVGGLENVEEP